MSCKLPNNWAHMCKQLWHFALSTLNIMCGTVIVGRVQGKRKETWQAVLSIFNYPSCLTRAALDSVSRPPPLDLVHTLLGSYSAITSETWCFEFFLSCCKVCFQMHYFSVRKKWTLRWSNFKEVRIKIKLFRSSWCEALLPWPLYWALPVCEFDYTPNQNFLFQFSPIHDHDLKAL